MVTRAAIGPVTQQKKPVARDLAGAGGTKGARVKRSITLVAISTGGLMIARRERSCSVLEVLNSRWAQERH